jgi:hypothetical protein
LIILVVLILLIGSIGYTALKLKSSNEQYTAEARRHFSALVDEAALLYSSGEQNKNRVFSLFRQNLRDFPNLRSLVLYDTDGRLHFVYGRTSAALSLSGEEAGLLPEDAVTQYAHQQYDSRFITSVPAEVGLPFSITARAVYETLPRDTVAASFKILFMSLVGCILILGTALALLPSGGQETVSAGEQKTAAAGAFYRGGNDIPQVPNEFYREPPPSFGTAAQAAPDRTESPARSDTAPSHSRNDHRVDAVPPDSDEHGEAGKGFFSPKTQLVRGEFFLSRLESELKRAASFDQDLTLMLFRCPEAGTTEPFSSLAEKAKAFFTFHDLIFELPEKTIAAIIPNTDLDEGITQSSNFQKKLFEEGDSCITDIRLGLSSRNGRLVEAQRVYDEAQTALKKAQSDPDHPSIVGFRPDPNKYRAYLSGQQT